MFSFIFKWDITKKVLEIWILFRNEDKKTDKQRQIFKGMGFEKISHLTLVKPLAAHLEVELRALKVFLQLRLNLLCLGKFNRRLVVHILRSRCQQISKQIF